MGRTSQIIESPVVRTLKWKNEKTKKDPKTKEVTVLRETGWYYFDKTLNDGEGENVKVELPISFIWLETAMSIMGYNEKTQKSVWSNEVLDLRTQPMVVKIDKEIEVEGLYADIKAEAKGIGGKFCSAVYALVDTSDGEKEIWRFLMAGSSNSAWITFGQRSKNKTHKIVCYETKFCETATGSSYEEPVFKYMPMTQADEKAADEAAEQVDQYFDYMLNKNSLKQVVSTTNGDYNDNDEVPF
jgi:hypothetical protein